MSSLQPSLYGMAVINVFTNKILLFTQMTNGLIGMFGNSMSITFSTGHGLKTSLTDSDIFQWVNLVYCGWDFSMFDPYNVKFKHILLKNEIEVRYC